MRIWLARHGTTTAPPGVAIGRTDVELAPEGRQQADELAIRLASCPLTHVYSSDLRRAYETAAIVAAHLRLRVHRTADLRELDFGAWEGRRLADLWTETPDEARAWEADFRRLPSSFGETFEILEERVGRFTRQLPASSGDVLVVAHRGPLAVLYALLTGSGIEPAWQLSFDLGSLTQLEVA
jgi:broad specificity phosphatase PhoE